MDNPADLDKRTEEHRILGDTAEIEFLAVTHHKPIEGKIDTGATTSSLDADWYDADTKAGKVTFTSRLFDDRKITMDLQGTQAVQTADHGIEVRPVIKLDIRINGVLVKDALFNLNDRRDMSPILIGQNILKAGNFIIDPNKDQSSVSAEDTVKPIEPTETPKAESYNEENVIKAIEFLKENNVTFSDIFKYLKTKAVESIKE